MVVAGAERGARWGRENKAGKGGDSHEADDLAYQTKGIELHSTGKGEALKVCTRKETTRAVCLGRSYRHTVDGLSGENNVRQDKRREALLLSGLYIVRLKSRWQL